MAGGFYILFLPYCRSFSSLPWAHFYSWHTTRVSPPLTYLVLIHWKFYFRFDSTGFANFAWDMITSFRHLPNFWRQHPLPVTSMGLFVSLGTLRAVNPLGSLDFFLDFLANVSALVLFASVVYEDLLEMPWVVSSLIPLLLLVICHLRTADLILWICLPFSCRRRPQNRRQPV